MNEAIALAQELSHPFSLAMAFSCAALVHQQRGEHQTTQERAEAAIALSAEHGFALYSAQDAILGGWALAQQGHPEEGIAQIQQGLAAWRATGTKHSVTYLLTLLAEACRSAGQFEQESSVLDEALTLAETNEDRIWAAEPHRFKGELLLRQENQRSNVKGQMSKVEEAEACFRQALEIARRQEAKSLELRTATSLARLWRQQGKRAEAYDLLTPVYDWFTEGFETADLQDAKALLTELSEGV